MFRDRQEAAERLACRLRTRVLHDPLVLGIPRGGVVLGAVLARALKADLDVVLSRKLRAPGRPELALGALAEDGAVYLDPLVRDWPDGVKGYLEVEKRYQAAEIARRKQHFRAVRPQARIGGRSVIVTDDGIATGATILAALYFVRNHRPRELIVAVPVCAADQVEEVRRRCDELVCLISPEDFAAVSQFYEDFGQVEDEEVVQLLREFAHAAWEGPYRPRSEEPAAAPARKETSMPVFRTILHPTDFSESSRAAFALACSLARDHGGRLVVLHVLEVPVAAYLGGVLVPEPEAELKTVWAKLRELRPDDPAIEVEHRLLEGEPAAEILGLAEEIDCDLIVMGTHGRTGLTRLALGSVAETVLRKAPCPVLTIKVAAPNPGEGASRQSAVAGAASRADSMRRLSSGGTQHQRGVAAAEAERVGNGDSNPVRAGGMWDVAEAAFRVWIIEIDRRRDGPVAHGDDTGQRLDGGGGGEQVAGHALGRADGNAADVVAKDLAQHLRLRDVADRGAGGVGVDVVHPGGFDPGIGQGAAHGGHGGAGVGAGDDHVEGIAGGAVAGHLGVSAAAANPGAVGALQHEDSAALAHHEAVAAPVEGPRGSAGVVVAARQGAEVAETGHGHRTDGHVAGPGQAHIYPAQAQPGPRLCQSHVAAGTGRRNRHGRAGQVQCRAGSLYERGVAGRRLPGPRCVCEAVAFPEQQPLRADAQRQADAQGLAALPQPGVAQGGRTAPPHQLLQAMQAGEGVGGQLEWTGDTIDLAGHLAGMLVDGKAGDADDAALSGQQVARELVVAVAQRRAGADASDPDRRAHG
jgi:predicted phosphoribosyltransferase/nucleotide-binding universal stress UspA family protein